MRKVIVFVAMLAMPVTASAQGLSQCQFYPWLCPPPGRATVAAGSGLFKLDHTLADVPGVIVHTTISRPSQAVMVILSAPIFLLNNHEATDYVEGVIQLTRGDGSVLKAAVVANNLLVSGLARSTVTLVFIDSGVRGPGTYKMRWSVLGANANLSLTGDATIDVIELGR